MVINRYYERAAGIDDTKKDEAAKNAARSELFGRLGKPCESCNVAVATLACEACACVLCALCSDDIHDEDGPLANHKLERAGVSACGVVMGVMPLLHLKVEEGVTL